MDDQFHGIDLVKIDGVWQVQPPDPKPLEELMEPARSLGGVCLRVACGFTVAFILPAVILAIALALDSAYFAGNNEALIRFSWILLYCFGLGLFFGRFD